MAKRRSFTPIMQNPDEQGAFPVGDGPGFGPPMDEFGNVIPQFTIPTPDQLGPPIAGDRDTARQIFGGGGGPAQNPVQPQAPPPTSAGMPNVSDYLPQGLTVPQGGLPAIPDLGGLSQFGGRAYFDKGMGGKMGGPEMGLEAGPSPEPSPSPMALEQMMQPGQGQPPGVPMEMPAPTQFTGNAPREPMPVAAQPMPPRRPSPSMAQPVFQGGAPSALFPEARRAGGLFNTAGGLMGGGIGAGGRSQGEITPTELLLQITRVLQGLGRT